MDILQMSVYGGVMVLAIVAVRLAVLRFLPKRMLVILWCIALARLLVPLEIPSRFSVYSFVGKQAEADGNAIWRQNDAEDRMLRPQAQTDSITKVRQAGEAYGGELSEQSKMDDGALLTKVGATKGTGHLAWIIWGTGAAACGIFFLAAYIRSLREFRMSLPARSDCVARWEECLRLAQGSFPWRRRLERGRRGTVRPVTVRVSDRTDVPLTYGIFQPVILLPKEIEQEGAKQPEKLNYVLWHEYMHIRHGDCLLKLIVVAAVCMHWFNPLVWAMYVLINRDIELACDESVVRHCGIDSKALYADMLIGMEARKSGLAPFCSYFGRNAAEERIRAVMGIKKKSLGIAILAAGVTLLFSMVFATSAADGTQQTVEKGAGNMEGQHGAVPKTLKADETEEQMYLEAGFVGSPEDSEEEIEEEVQQEIRKQWDTLLACYKPFGLTYEYDTLSGDCRMYFQGQAVQGIMDEEQDIWIAGHAGTGETLYGEAAKDAIEVYTVYEDGKLAGLRAATREEQEEWDLLRKKNTDDFYNNVQEVREFLPGTKEDYRAIFSLKKPDYKQMTLAEFNSALLDWGNENYDCYDRIMCDRIWDDFRVSLSAEEKDFISCTVNLSSQENAMYVRSIYKGTPTEDVSLGDTCTKSLEDGEVQYAWCQMYYQFSYHVADREKATVGERDRCVGGMVEAIEAFWDETDIEDILKMEKSDLIKELNRLARKYSSDNIIITVGTEEQIGLESIDERELMREREEWERG